MEEKSCENCKYYVQHYIKHKRFLLKVNCGHCTNDKLKNKFARENAKLRKNCEYWEKGDQKEERRKIIKEVLRDIDQSLEEIKIILQSDEE